MASKNHKESEDVKAFLERLTDFLGDSENQTIEEVKNELKEQGIDINNITVNIKKMISETIEQKKKQWIIDARKTREHLRKQIEESEVVIPDDPKTIKEKIKEIIGAREHHEQALAFFRNFDKMTDDDLKHLYKDYLNLIRLRGDSSNND